MVARNYAVLFVSILAKSCVGVAESGLWQPSSGDSSPESSLPELPQTFHVKHQPHSGVLDKLGARVMARREAIVRSLAGLPKQSSRENLVKDTSAVSDVARRLQNQEYSAPPIMQPRRRPEIADVDSKEAKAVPSTVGIKTVAAAREHIKGGNKPISGSEPANRVHGRSQSVPEQRIARESRSVETVPRANSSDGTDSDVEPDLGQAISQIIAINGTMNVALGTVQLVHGKTLSAKRKSQSLCGIVEIEHLEVCTWFKQYEASLKPWQVQEFEVQSPQFHGHDSRMLAVCDRLYSHTCLADPTDVCDQAKACSYVPVCNAYKDMLPAVPDGMVLETCPETPPAGVKELWGGDVPDLPLAVPNADGAPVAEAGQQQVKMVTNPALKAKTHSKASDDGMEDAEDADEFDEQQALEDIEDEDAADESDVHAKLVKDVAHETRVEEKIAKEKAKTKFSNFKLQFHPGTRSPAQTASPVQLVKAKPIKPTASPGLNKKEYRASLRKAVRDPVRGGAPSISGPAAQVVTNPDQTIPQHMSVSKEIENAESAIKTAIKAVEPMATRGGSHTDGKASSKADLSDDDMRDLTDMTSFWNKVTDSAAAVIKNASTNSTSTTDDDKDHSSPVIINHKTAVTTTSKAAAVTIARTTSPSATTSTTAKKTTATTTTTTTSTTAATTTATTTFTTKAATQPTATTTAFTTTTTVRAGVSNATIVTKPFDVKKAADKIITKEKQVQAMENRLETALRLDKDDKADNDSTVEVDDFAPVVLNGTSRASAEHGSRTATTHSQSSPALSSNASVLPPWESSSSATHVTDTPRQPTPAAVVNVPPWISEGMGDKSVQKDSHANDADPPSRKHHTHTIRDAIKSYLKKDSPRPVKRKFPYVKDHDVESDFQNDLLKTHMFAQPNTVQTKSSSGGSSVKVSRKRHGHTIRDALQESLKNGDFHKMDEHEYDAVKTKARSIEKHVESISEHLNSLGSLDLGPKTSNNSHFLNVKENKVRKKNDQTRPASKVGKNQTSARTVQRQDVASHKETVSEHTASKTQSKVKSTHQTSKANDGRKRAINAEWRKEDRGGWKRHNIKEHDEYDEYDAIKTKKANQIKQHHSLADYINERNTIEKSINAAKDKEGEAEDDDDQDEDDEAEGEDDEDGDDDEDSDDDEEGEDGKSDQGDDEEEDDDDSLLQSAPWVGMN